jgi:hypothetical protein
MKSKLVSDSNRQVHINMDAINAYTSRWVPGTAFYFELVRRMKKVSDPQRRYYWSTVLPCFLDAYWYERDEADIVHRHLKILFFGVQPDSHGIYRDKDIPSVFSNIPTISPEERKRFIDAVIRKCAQSPDNPIMVPEPGEK